MISGELFDTLINFLEIMRDGNWQFVHGKRHVLAEPTGQPTEQFRPRACLCELARKFPGNEGPEC